MRVEPPISGVNKTDIGLSSEFNGRSSPTNTSVPIFSDSSLGSYIIPKSVMDEIERNVNEDIESIKLRASKMSGEDIESIKSRASKMSEKN